MKLNTEKCKAKDVSVDSLIYLPEEKRFFWVDDVQYDEDSKEYVFIFEEEITRKGLVTHELRFKGSQTVINVINDLQLSKTKELAESL